MKMNFKKEKNENILGILNFKKMQKNLEKKERKEKINKKIHKVIDFILLGTAGYVCFKVGKEFTKKEIRDTLLNVDFISEIGKKTTMYGINSLDDINGNTIHIYPKK